MLLLLLRPTLLLSLLLTLPVWLIQPQPYDLQPVAALLTPPEGCAAPCFFAGIRPGSTRLDVALLLLDAHPWVEQYETYYFMGNDSFKMGVVRWTWSDARPASIDARFPGQLSFHTVYGKTLVEGVNMRTTLPPPQVIAWYGLPSGGVLSRREQSIVYGVLYKPQPSSIYIGVTASMSCPLNRLDLWYSGSEVFMTDWDGIRGPYVEFSDAVASC